MVKNKERETYKRWEGPGLEEKIYSIDQNFPCMKKKKKTAMIEYLVPWVIALWFYMII